MLSVLGHNIRSGTGLLYVAEARFCFLAASRPFAGWRCSQQRVAVNLPSTISPCSCCCCIGSRPPVRPARDGGVGHRHMVRPYRRIPPWSIHPDHCGYAHRCKRHSGRVRDGGDTILLPV